MVLKSLSDLKGIVSGKPRKKLVLAAAHDQHSLGAVIQAWHDDIVEPILIGDARAIQNICMEYGYNIDGLQVIHEPVTEMSVERAVRMLNGKQADVLMKGKVGTTILLKCVLNREWGLRTGNLLSHIALF